MREVSVVQKILFFLVIGLSIWLRLYHYTYFPQRGATSDEYTYSFLGTSLLTRGVPISWSAFQAYHNRRDLTIDGIYFPIVSPYFDHPPLYALTLGALLLAFGEGEFRSQHLATIRFMPIILSTITGLLLFFLAKRLYGYSVALVAFTLYSSVTVFVMNQRVSVAENQLALLFVVGIFLFQRWRRKITVNRIVLLGIISGLAFLTKIMGVALFISFLVLFIYEKVSWKKIGAFFLPFALGLLLLLLYAWYFDWQLFWAIQTMQSGRNIGPQSLLMLAIQPVIVNKVYFDGWYFLGLLSFGFLSATFKKHALILLPALTYFILLLATLTREGQSGWYMIPEFPFMSIAIAFFVLETLRTKRFVFLLVPLLVGFSQIQYFFEPFFGLSSLGYRFLLLLFFFPLLLLFLMRREEWYSKIGYIYFFFFLIVTIGMTHRYIHPS